MAGNWARYKRLFKCFGHFPFLLPCAAGFRKPRHMIRPILIHPDPRLKKLCDPVAEITAEVRQLAADMLETMYDAPGIGLAAPQVGVTKRVIVMDCIKEGTPEPMALVNPEIIWSSEDQTVYEEGCLSIPDIYNDITRPAEVKVRWTDLDGKQQERQFAGIWATCVQHEIDHLDGKLFIDYLGPLKRQMITRKMEKLKRERARAV
jgi:peptide deformylase